MGLWYFQDGFTVKQCFPAHGFSKSVKFQSSDRAAEICLRVQLRPDRPPSGQTDAGASQRLISLRLFLCRLAGITKWVLKLRFDYSDGHMYLNTVGSEPAVWSDFYL